MTTRLSHTFSPPTKRIKLELSPLPHLDDECVETKRSDVKTEEVDDVEHVEDIEEIEEIETEHCSICLQPFVDRTVIPTCSHEFCFECLLVWTDQSRRCPLCSQTIGDYLIHNIRSKYDFQKHFLAPLRTSPGPPHQLRAPPSTSTVRRTGTRRERQWGRSTRLERDLETLDELERAVEKRKWVYRHGLYAKHVASNSYTRYRPFPTPALFGANPDLITRATIFIRRELRVWGCLDVEFLTTYTISVMKSLDIRSESAIKLLAEFLDMGTEHYLNISEQARGPRANAEHFAHELYSYLRSPFWDLSVYDSVVQYDTPEGVQSPYHRERSRRWRSRSHSESRSPSPSRSRSGSVTHSHRRIRPTSPSIRNQHYQTHPRPTSPQEMDRTETRPSSIPPQHPKRSHTQTEDMESDHYEEGYQNADWGKKSSRDVKGKGRAINCNDRNERLLTRDDYEESPDGRCTLPNDAASQLRVQDASLSHVSIPARTHDIPSAPKEIPVGPDSEPIALSTERPPSFASKEVRPRVPRSALESLRSHLSIADTAGEKSNSKRRNNRIGPRSEPSTHGTSRSASNMREDGDNCRDAVKVMRPTQSNEVGNSALPSLLHRLSDPVNNPASFTDTNDSSSTISRANITDRLSQANIADSKGKGTIGMSAPEIMARTRARLAKIKRDTGSQNVSIEGGKSVCRTSGEEMNWSIGDVSAGPVGVASNSLTSDPACQQIAGDNSSISLNPVGSSTSSDNLRARLLSKLEDERRAHQQDLRNDEDDSSTIISSPAPMDLVNGTAHAPVVDTSLAIHEAQDSQMLTSNDAAMKEVKLRSQAQLRARLAAEKKHADGAFGTSVNDSGVDREEDHVKRIGEREELLKARLKRTRVGDEA